MIKEPQSRDIPLESRAPCAFPKKGSPASVAGFSRQQGNESPVPHVSTGDIERILTAHQDCMLVKTLENALALEFPCALRDSVTSVEALRSRLAAEPADLLIVSAHLPGGDGFSVLADSKRACPRQRLLFVTTRYDYQFAQVPCARLGRGAPSTRPRTTLPASGRPCAALRPGRPIGARVSEPMLRGGFAFDCGPSRHLTPMEMFLFAILGDGCSDGVAASMVDLSEQSVHSYRKRLHRKLGNPAQGSTWLPVRSSTVWCGPRPTGWSDPGWSCCVRAVQHRRGERMRSRWLRACLTGGRSVSPRASRV
jgi:DNA-binding NarL/FixJ family response regulator